MVLIDANVLIDTFTPDSDWHAWSVREVDRHRAEGLAINPIIYAEVSIGFESPEALHALLAGRFEFVNLPWEAAFIAGRAFLAYRDRGGARTSPLPDFYIGAHAQVSGLKLLTRDGRRYRSYFPDVEIIAPA